MVHVWVRVGVWLGQGRYAPRAERLVGVIGKEPLPQGGGGWNDRLGTRAKDNAEDLVAAARKIGGGERDKPLPLTDGAGKREGGL